MVAIESLDVAVVGVRLAGVSTVGVSTVGVLVLDASTVGVTVVGVACFRGNAVQAASNAENSNVVTGKQILFIG